MSELGYKIDSAELMPIRAITFHDADNGNSLHFFHIESDSDWGGLQTITRPDHRGGVKVVGYRLAPVIYVPTNTFHYSGGALLAALQAMQGRYVNTVIVLGNAATWNNMPSALFNPLPEVINDTDSMIVDYSNKLMFHYAIESVQYRPRLVLKPTGIIRNPLLVADTGTDIERILLKE